ncbi:MAG: hypothetical protein NT126_02300 [Bacteroidetes bacterium]|nr:hypothetical protein [Bacteroidota bacterium]
MALRNHRIFLFTWFIILVLSFYMAFLKKHKTSGAYVQRTENVNDQPEDSLQFGLLQKDFFDLEKTGGLLNESAIAEGAAFSGRMLCKLSGKNEFGVTYDKKFSVLNDFKHIRKVVYKTMLKSEGDLKDACIVLNITTAEGTSLDWQSQPLGTGTDNWESREATFTIRKQFLQPENVIKLYTWNKSKQQFSIDDIDISFYGMVEKKEKEEPVHDTVVKQTNFFFDFENESELSNTDMIVDGNAHSGKRAVKLDGHHSYSPALNRKFKEVSSGNLKSVSMSAWFNSTVDNPEIVLVASASNSEGKEYSWNGKDTKKFTFRKNTWYKLNADFLLPSEKNNPGNKITVYLWNKGGSALYMDDFEIVFHDGEIKNSVAPNVVIDPFKEYTYVPHRNKPPFYPAFLEKADIGNHDGIFLVDDNSGKEGELLPGDQFVTGNFLKDSKKSDELVRVNGHGAEMFGFCQADKKFKKIWSEKNAEEIKSWDESRSISGDFNRDGKDEIFRIGKNNHLQLLELSPEIKSGTCEALPANRGWNILWENKDVTFSGWTLDESDVYLPGNFTGDGTCTLCIIKPATGDWQLLQYSGKTWKVISSSLKGNKNRFPPAPTGSWISKGCFKEKDVLIIKTNRRGENELAYLEFNTVTGNFNTINFHDQTDSKLVSSGSKIFIGNFDNKHGNEMMIYDRTWRFDMKLAVWDIRGMTILNTLDFKGYPGDQNPKYYESLQLIPGHFISGSATDFLVVMRNQYDGDKNKNYLPNRVQLYSITPR